jgi:hypothetical protein
LAYNAVIICPFFSFFLVCYLTMLSISSLYTIGDRMVNEYGAVGGMRMGRGNQSTHMPLCPPQIPQDLTWDQTQAASN